MTLGPVCLCPDCGYDPTGPDSEYKSGGGWLHDTSVQGTAQGLLHVTRWRCPECRTVVEREESEMEL